MAKITTAQADEFVVLRDIASAPGKVHSHYSFIVKNADGQVIKWNDDTLDENATKAQKKAVMMSKIKSVEKEEPEVKVTITDDKHNLVGMKMKDA